MTSSAPNNTDVWLIAQFLEMMSAERGAAANSLAAYGRDLRNYMEFLFHRGIGLKAVGTDDVRGFLADAEHSGMARTTAARRLSAVKQFHLFLLFV